MRYEEFLETKRRDIGPTGTELEADGINPKMFPFQSDILRWAVRRGRAAIFARYGLGKTLIQLEWAKQVHQHTGDRVMIFAPLAVAKQTVREGARFGYDVTLCRTSGDVGDGINVTNYELLHHFEPEPFGAVILDESSILKSYGGHYRQALTGWASELPFRLCCTATPAPNDLVEIINHAEFLGILRGKEIIALFFTQDGNTTHSWRLKGHAIKPFWRWLSSWACAVRSPSDLNYPNEGFDLPPLNWHEHIVESAPTATGHLFAMEAQTLQERRSARRESLPRRVAMAAEIVAREPDEPWIIWCNLNAESEAITRAIPGAVEIRGSDSLEDKEERLLGFTNGDVRVLVTKPSIAGFGLNWQHCARVIYLGLSDSFEQLDQSVHRCHRFGQKRPVEAHVITSQAEGAVRRNIERKQRQAEAMMDELVGEMKEIQLDRIIPRTEYREDIAEGDGWRLMLGDSTERTREIESDSVGLVLFSPPFPGMYAYTDSERDVGNSATTADVIEHFRFMMADLLRVTMPGRRAILHITQEPIFKWQEGHIGLRDFRGELIKAMEAEGWYFYCETTIDKNPQAKATRTKDATLQFKSLAKDSAIMRPAMPDYLLHFMKHGENPVPIPNGPNGEVSNEEWVLWARPVWYGHDLCIQRKWPAHWGIRESDVLNVREAREADDEKHLCPLQLGVIERAVRLWTAPGDLVYSPFAGVGSEGYMAVKLDRRFVGCELKESYWRQAQKYLAQAGRDQMPLFASLKSNGEAS